jgi:hypothetical protein
MSTQDPQDSQLQVYKELLDSVNSSRIEQDFLPLLDQMEQVELESRDKAKGTRNISPLQPPSSLQRTEKRPSTSPPNNVPHSKKVNQNVKDSTVKEDVLFTTTIHNKTSTKSRIEYSEHDIDKLSSEFDLWSSQMKRTMMVSTS